MREVESRYSTPIYADGMRISTLHIRAALDGARKEAPSPRERDAFDLVLVGGTFERLFQSSIGAASAINMT